MPKTDFVDAYSKTTGKLQRIPKSWLDRTDAPFTDFTTTKPTPKATGEESPSAITKPSDGTAKAVKAETPKETK
jgi:hypothetical protein